MSTGFGIVNIGVWASSGARRLRSAAMTWLGAMIASARASVARFRRRFARMYGISDQAAGEAAPARGRTQRVIIATVQSGQSDDCDGS
jgi:hypothetical protein